MITGKFKKNPKKYLILVGAVIAVIVIIVLMASTMMKPVLPSEKTEEEKEELVYEVEVGDIKFKLKEVKDRGDILKASESKHPGSTREDLTTTERFIEVTISAQNVGKDNIQSGGWEVKELIDSEERKFYSSRQLDNWILEENKCSDTLKPGFSPTFCTKIYEVAKISTGLKVEVSARKGGSDFIDLGI